MKRFIMIVCCILFFQDAFTQDLPTVRLGVVSYIGDATNLHAYESGYFKDEGLNVVLKRNSFGAQSLRQVTNGELDIGATAPTPIVYASMGARKFSPDFRVVASILESTNMNHVVILDKRAIPDPSHLPGKRLGITLGTASEFLWHNVSLAFGIDPDSPQIINIKVPKMAEAASRGEVDAVVAWSPFHLEVVNAVDSPSIIFSGAEYYTTSWIVVARPDYIQKHPDRIKAYLRALLRAEKDLQERPEKIAANHSKYVKTSPEVLLERYNDIDFKLSLSESFIINLNQQADWARDKGYVEGEIPDMRGFIHDTLLRELRPNAVNLLE